MDKSLKSEEKFKVIPEEQGEENPGSKEFVNETPKQSAGDLTDEEEILQQTLEKLKKENFSLKASINAWQETLESKLKEIKETELKLDDFYNEIWSERENFCLKADQFNGEIGILSDWWQTQMSFVTDLEKLRQKRKQEKECRENIEKLQQEIKELKSEVKELTELRKISVEVEIHAAENEEAPICSKSPSPEKVETTARLTKQVRFLEPEDEILQLSEVISPDNELYSLMNVEKVKMAKRMRNLHNRNASLGKKAKPLETYETDF